MTAASNSDARKRLAERGAGATETGQSATNSPSVGTDTIDLARLRELAAAGKPFAHPDGMGGVAIDPPVVYGLLASELTALLDRVEAAERDAAFSRVGVTTYVEANGASMALATRYKSERDALRQKLARVEALCDRWRRMGPGDDNCRLAADVLAAALADPEGDDRG